LRIGPPSDHVQSKKTTASLLELPTMSIPQIVVNDETKHDDDEATSPPEGLRSEDSPAAFRPRRQTLSLDPTDRSPSLVLPVRTMSLSASPRSVYTGEWIRVLLQRRDASNDAQANDPP